jgi:UDP-GlcNAc:undecaprenyl-phosphate GlcNAc-1-phosphate transferase
MSTEEIFACFYVGGLAFGLAVTLVPVAKLLAEKVGVMDYPNERKVHRTPKPLLGGMAIFAALLIVIVGHIAALSQVQQNQTISSLFPGVLSKLGTITTVYPILLSLFAGSVIVFAVGVLDDVYESRFPVWAKLTGQSLAALVVVAKGVHISLFEFNPLVAGAVTLVWIVGITNSFNLLDNMDGLSAGVGVICGLLLLIIAGSLGELYICMLLSALVGSLGGFLVHNFHPSKIFLGDTGSLLIGYLFGVITVLASFVAREGAIQNTLFAPFMPVVVLGLPLYDTASVIIIRWRERRPIHQGDKCHLSHRLVELGMTERQAVLLIYLLTFCLGAPAIFLKEASPLGTLLALCQSLGIVGLTTILMVVYRKTYFVQIRAFNDEQTSGEFVPANRGESEEKGRRASPPALGEKRSASPPLGYEIKPQSGQPSK